jgi:hypothetical protein
MRTQSDLTFMPLSIEERPHDGTGTAKGWSFKTLEHDEHTFPHAIEATDAQGRSAIYVPLKRRGCLRLLVAWRALLKSRMYRHDRAARFQLSGRKERMLKTRLVGLLTRHKSPREGPPSPVDAIVRLLLARNPRTNMFSTFEGSFIQRRIRRRRERSDAQHG